MCVYSKVKVKVYLLRSLLDILLPLSKNITPVVQQLFISHFLADRPTSTHERLVVVCQSKQRNKIIKTSCDLRHVLIHATVVSNLSLHRRQRQEWECLGRRCAQVRAIKREWLSRVRVASDSCSSPLCIAAPLPPNSTGSSSPSADTKNTTRAVTSEPPCITHVRRFTEKRTQKYFFVSYVGITNELTSVAMVKNILNFNYVFFPGFFVQYLTQE